MPRISALESPLSLGKRGPEEARPAKGASVIRSQKLTISLLKSDIFENFNKLLVGSARGAILRLLSHPVDSATIYAQQLTGYEARFIADEKQHRIRNVLRLP